MSQRHTSFPGPESGDLTCDLELCQAFHFPVRPGNLPNVVSNQTQLLQPMHFSWNIDVACQLHSNRLQVNGKIDCTPLRDIPISSGSSSIRLSINESFTKLVRFFTAAGTVLICIGNHQNTAMQHRNVLKATPYCDQVSALGAATFLQLQGE